MPTLNISLTAVQAETLAKEAEAFGVTRGSLVKMRTFGKSYSPRRAPRPDQRELARIVGQLGKAGSNINQIARQLNSQTGKPPVEFLRDMREAKEALQAISSEVQKALGIPVSTKDER